MVAYRYIAEDADGRQVTGRVDATDRDQAVELLRERGLVVRELEAIPAGVADEPLAAATLSDSAADEVTRHIAQLGSAHLPMSDGLRAAADESGDRRVAAALRGLADRMDRGETLERILSGPENPLPRPLAGLIHAASRTGRLGSALVELSDHQRASRYLRRDMFGAFAYPLVVLGITTCVFAAALIYVGGIFDQVYEEFGLQLPVMTEILLWWRRTGIWVLATGLCLAIGVAVVYRLMAGRVRWLRLVSAIPLFGPLLYWSGVTDWAGLLSVLLRHEVELPEALRLAGHGIRNAHVGRVSIRLADGVSRGRSTWEMIAATHQLPASLVPLIRWGETTGTLAESLAVCCQVFEKRVRNRALLLQTLLPPVLFVMIGCSVLFLVLGLFLPLFGLITSLS